MQKIKSVEDLGTASYVLMHNYKLAGRRGREVLFDIEEEKGQLENDLNSIKQYSGTAA